MKKLFTLFFTFFLLACTEQEVIKQESEDRLPIGFKTFVHKQTRAGLTNITTLQSNGFKVTAAFTGSDNMSDTKPLNYLIDEQVDYTNPDWIYTNIRYWPANNTDKISFFAYDDINSNLSVKNTTGYPQVDFTVPDQQADQTDFLVAAVTNQARPAVNTPIYFGFYHALSAMSFAIKTDHTANEVTLHSMTINKKELINKGTYVFADHFTGSSWVLDPTEKFSDVEDVIFSGQNAAVSVFTYGSLIFGADDNFELFIPQDVVANSVPITLSFSLETPLGATLDGYEATGYLPAMTLEKGKNYQMNLLLKIDDALSNFAIEFGEPTIPE